MGSDRTITGGDEGEETCKPRHGAACSLISPALRPPEPPAGAGRPRGAGASLGPRSGERPRAVRIPRAPPRYCLLGPRVPAGSLQPGPGGRGWSGHTGRFCSCWAERGVSSRASAEGQSREAALDLRGKGGLRGADAGAQAADPGSQGPGEAEPGARAPRATRRPFSLYSGRATLQKVARDDCHFPASSGASLLPQLFLGFPSCFLQLPAPSPPRGVSGPRVCPRSPAFQPVTRPQRSRPPRLRQQLPRPGPGLSGRRPGAPGLPEWPDHAGRRGSPAPGRGQPGPERRGERVLDPPLPAARCPCPLPAARSAPSPARLGRGAGWLLLVYFSSPRVCLRVVVGYPPGGPGSSET